MQKLIATKSLTYATRRLLPGDRFEAKDRDAKLLLAIKKARAAPERQAANVSPPPARVSEKIVQTQAKPDLQKLRDEAASHGIEVDGRWGADRLRDEIEKAVNQHAFQISDQS